MDVLSKGCYNRRKEAVGFIEGERHDFYKDIKIKSKTVGDKMRKEKKKNLSKKRNTDFQRVVTFIVILLVMYLFFK